MNILGYSIVKASWLTEQQYSQEKNQTEVQRLRKICTADADVLMKQKNELRDLKTQLETSQTREISLIETLTERNQRVVDQEAQIVAAQTGRVEHNNVLKDVGQAWLNFKSAWQFRTDNPKMGPQQRKENNETLTANIQEIDVLLPKQIADPTKTKSSREQLADKLNEKKQVIGI